MVETDDSDFQEMLHRRMIDGYIPYQERIDANYREHDIKNDFKGYPVEPREEDY
jgi:hypothetical protein